MKKFNTILFDIDGTLLDFDKTEKAALLKTFAECGIDNNVNNISIYSKVNSSLWEMLEEGKIEKEKLKTERFRQFFNIIDIDVDINLASKTYIDNLAESFYYLEGAVELCKKLSPKYRLAISTNGIAKVQHSRIKLSGLDEHFKYIFISDEIGYPKPKKEFFDHIFAKLNIIDKSKVIIIGDSLTSDIKGGNNAGIATCWYNPNELSNNADSICDYTIKSLYEFEAILNE